MGRPIGKKFFGPVVAGGTQLSTVAWVDGDTQARPGYIIKQSGSERYHVQTSFGQGECQLVETITQPGQMIIQLVADGTPGTQSVRKLTDREVYSFTNDNYYVNWEPVNGQVSYGEPGPGTAWAASFGHVSDATEDYSQGITFDTTGNIVVTGNQDWYQIFGPTVAYIMKMTADGDIVWQKALSWNSNLGESAGQVVMCDSSNNIFVSITKFSGATPFPNVLIKLDSNGNILWQKELEDFGACKDMVVDTDGSVAIAAMDTRNIAKYDSTGNLLWQKSFSAGNLNATIQSGCSIAFSDNHKLVISFPYNFNDSGITKAGQSVTALDSAGNKVWETGLLYNNSSQSYFYSASDADTTGNIFVQTAVYDTDFIGNYSGLYSKWQPDGTLVWQKQVNNNNLSSMVPFAVRSTDDGTTYSVGNGCDHTIGLCGIAMQKRDANGNLLWQRLLSQQSGNIGQDYFYGGGARDVSVYEDNTVWAGYGKLQEPQAFFHGLVTHLPTDGSKTGTFGVFTYSESDYNELNPACTLHNINVAVSNTSLASTSGSLTLETLELGLEFTSFG